MGEVLWLKSIKFTSYGLNIDNSGVIIVLAYSHLVSLNGQYQ